MVLQGCKSTPQKSRPIESGHGRHAVQVANVCSYKLGQKMNFNFGANLAGFCMHSQGKQTRIIKIKKIKVGTERNPLLVYVAPKLWKQGIRF